MRLGAGTLRQEIGNQSPTFFLNEHGPTEDHSLTALPVNVLWQVAGEMLPSLPLWSVPALLQMKTKPLGHVGSLRWQKRKSLNVGSTPSVLERARDEIVLHGGIFYGMVCVVNLAIKARPAASLEGLMPELLSVSEKVTPAVSFCWNTGVVSELFLLRAVGSSISRVFSHQKEFCFALKLLTVQVRLVVLITAVPQPAWPASLS